VWECALCSLATLSHATRLTTHPDILRGACAAKAGV
jgi:hypothetical protein